MVKLPPRFWIVVFGGLALLALILLAASLDALQLEPGRPLSGERINPLGGMTGPPSGVADWVLVAFRILMIIFWVLLPFYIVYLFISKEARRRFIRDMAMLLPIFLLIYLLTNSNLGQQAAQDMEGRFGMGQEETLGTGEEAPPLPEFAPPPPWVTTATSIALAAVITVVVVAVAYAIWRRARERSMALEPIRQLERQAQDALDSLNAGGDLRETIQRCYLQMIQTVSEYKNIQRDRDMTPHEFEQTLERHGLPREPVHQLTQLFEQVRYGGHNPGRTEERLAVSSLSSIVSACQRARAR